MTKRERAYEAVELLEREYAEAVCSLDYPKDYELLFCVRLAAQCTDERVNKISPALFEAFPTLQSFADADVEDVEKLVHSCGFYKSKARDIVAAAKMLISHYGGKVPDSMEELLALPGVGRKTANLILGDIYNKPAVVVDTHCIRISNRLGFVDTKDALKIEKTLRELLPEDKSNDYCHRLVLHGRAVCRARGPLCGDCCLNQICPKII